MTQQLREAISLLQLSNLDLCTYVSNFLEQNPFLEWDQDFERHTESLEEKAPDEDAYFKDSLFGDRNQASSQSKDDGEERELVIPQKKGLHEYLLEQLHSIFLSPIERAIGTYIIYNINERGYLELSLEDITERLKCSFRTASDVLSLIQEFDPSGVGATSLVGCLKVQLQDQKKLTPRLEKILEILSELPQLGFQPFAKKLKIREEDLVSDLKVLRQCDPFPGLSYAFEAPQTLIPDVYVKRHGEELMVTVNPSYLPRPSLQKNYYEDVKERTRDKSSLQTIQGYYNQATWLMNALEQRRETLIKVSQEIVSEQKEFFLKGIHCLKPMIFQDIAERVGVHESTISRIVQNKYLATEKGIFPFKYFFATGFQSRTQEHSAQYIKSMMRGLIEAESRAKPLSDDTIVQVFQKKGVTIARRTIAKYRIAMGIPSSSERKRLKTCF